MMPIRTINASIVLLLLIFVSGCTHTRLRRSTASQSFTSMKIYEKQVLDNLAMFSVNKYAIPSFSTLSAGSADVTDKGALKMEPLDELREKIGLTAERTVKAGWNLVPISDSHKLHLMRCAYQRAIGMVNANCPNCCALEAKFEGKDLTDNEFNCGECRGACWFRRVQRKRDIPDNCCELVGEFCGHYVYVPPSGRDEFAILVLQILDYATHAGHGAVKVVEFESEKGLKQKAEVPVDATPDEIKTALGLQKKKQNTDSRDEVINEIKRGPLIDSTPRANILDLDRRLQTLGL